jgi:hypothetical protein
VAVQTVTRLVAAWIAVEVTRRSKWRMFGIKGMALLADAVRPPVVAAAEDVVAGPAVPLPPLAAVERGAFDYRNLELGMAQLALVLRQTRRSLDALVRGTGVTTGR